MSIKLSIPEPCSQNWTDMSVVPGGRHCASCQKAVVDFTAMTDVELAAFIKQFPHFGCGRFRPDQIGRPILPQASPQGGLTRIWAPIAASAALILSLASVTAQSHAGRLPRIGKSRIHTTPLPPATPQTDTPCLRLSGEVLGATSQPVPFAVVQLHWDTRIIARSITDSAGRFELSTDLNIPLGTPLMMSASCDGISARVWHRLGSRVEMFVIQLRPLRFNLDNELRRDQPVIMGATFGSYDRVTDLIKLDSVLKQRKKKFR